MSHSRIQELAMKIVDADATHSDRSPDRLPAALDVSSGADTHASPGLRPEVLGDAAQRQTKAMIHAALFKATGEASTIGPYQVLKLLGEGGMGVVYAAYDDKLERKVALKLIRGAALRRPEGRARTLREARALARVSHPNVVHVYQVGEVDDEIYVAMEFLTGPTLRAWLAAKPRTWREALAVFRQAGEGLAAAHRQGVIHRDFKPKSRRPSQTAPQPIDRPHSHQKGRFEGVAVDRLAPPCSHVPQVLAKRWQWPGPPEDRRGRASAGQKLSQETHDRVSPSDHSRHLRSRERRTSSLHRGPPRCWRQHQRGREDAGHHTARAPPSHDQVPHPLDPIDGEGWQRGLTDRSCRVGDCQQL
ncbi:MAG: serine/threonine protein kinase [Nannocystis sp.]|nr:serine/threonine-protein kinase [Nannocystis sp.]MBA3548179.1 serine/threonine protein kinase [Nannocystis sp.]